MITDKRELPDWLAVAGVVDVPTGISGFGSRHGRTSRCRTAACCIAASASSRTCGRTWPAGPLDHIIDEVRRLVDDGYREIVLTGIHLGHYGVEWSRDRARDNWLHSPPGSPNTEASRISAVPVSAAGDDFRTQTSFTALLRRFVRWRSHMQGGPSRIRESSLPVFGPLSTKNGRSPQTRAQDTQRIGSL